MISFRDATNPWVNFDGIVRGRGGDQGQGLDGNAALYTGTRFVLLHKFGELTPKLRDRIDFNKALLVCEKQPGLLSRAYKYDEFQSHDDYVGMLAASYFVELKSGIEDTFAKRALAHGKRFKYCWNNLAPSKWDVRGFFVRIPGFYALLKACSGERIGPLQQLLASVDMLVTVLKDDGSSGHNLDYLKMLVYDDKSWGSCPIVKLGVMLTRMIYKKKHPNGRTESYATYFGDDHPFAKYTIGVF